MAVCTKCGHQNQDESKFCAQCATPLAQPFSQYQAQAQPAQPKKKGARAAIFVAAGIGVFAFLPMLFFADACGSGTVEGEILSEGKPHGDYVMKPEACHSGQHEQWFGVWVAPKLETKGGSTGFQGGLKIVKDHAGEWTLFIESPNECKNHFDCKIRPLDKKHCTKFDVSVSNTNTTINDIRVREGYANLDCKFPEGGKYKTNLKFSGCH